MPTAKTISVHDEDLWQRAMALADTRAPENRRNLSGLIEALLYQEVVVKERERKIRMTQDPVARLRRLADLLNEAGREAAQLADALES